VTNQAADDYALMVQRAHAMTVMHLTRRPDLILSDPTRADEGLDYVVILGKKRVTTRRRFGLLVTSTIDATTPEAANKRAKQMLACFRKLPPFLFPVCCFYFTMADDQAYYAWIYEPIVSDNGQPRLPLAEKVECHVLDRAALDLIVDRVDRWYDAFFAKIAV
jgi:hypothetical protein